ncbi:hypothetical protein [Streptomyces sp. NBC_01363]|uniref:hypothetical protein n=1 Tax=Streptomyces sp. NBC_01363 TaxID=2903840 RepID=UPI0022529D7E|nr:hypothetical protein [Streptomyces sp. NBC_01363]MCX4732716.1 hypothetical protein [Streptomyces sp. NBC_01363]
MAVPTPEEQAGEAFVEASAEAVQTAVAAFRLMTAIADAVRRHQQKKAGKEEELPPVDESVIDAFDAVKKALPPDISEALLEGADWPQLAQQLMALRHAGVDLEALLPRVGEITVTVRDQVAANAERVAREGTDEWAKALRETMPAGPVREAILSSPAWPEMAATMAKLDERGVDVRAILASAHEEGVGVDRAVAKVLSAAEVPTTSRDAMLSYGPMSEGLDLPTDYELSDRAQTLKKFAIPPQENERFIRMVKTAMPGREREVDLMVAARQWPLVAARMAEVERQKESVPERLAGLMKDTSWEQEGSDQLGSRLARAAGHVLRYPPGKAPEAGRPKVSTVAARSQSSTVGLVKGQESKGATPAEPGVAAHRQTGPAAKTGKTR